MRKSLSIEKVEELREKDLFDDSDITEKAESDFELRKWTASVWSDIPELNKDFTLSNLSDNMFESKVVNFIRNRIFVTKMLRNLFKYANRDLKLGEEEGGLSKEEYKEEKRKEKEILLNISDEIKDRIRWETIEYNKTRSLIMAEVYTILNLSKARGGLVLKSFLKGSMSEEEAELIAGAGEPAVGEPIKRSWMDRLLGRKVPKKQMQMQQMSRGFRR